MRARWPVLGLTAFVLIAGFLGRFLPDTVGGEIDFVEYWAAAKLLDEGKNPYDAEVLLPLQQSVGWQGERAQMMWNPPWVFPIVWPLAFVRVTAGFLGAAALQLGMIALSCVWCWRRSDRWVVPVLLGLLFAPTIFLLRLGQSSGFLLFGMAAFAAALRGNRPIAAGLAVALTAFKPHLFFPFAVLFVAESFRDRATRKALIAGAVTLGLASLFPLLFKLEIWQQFVVAIRSPGDQFHYSPSDWKPPILSAKIAAETGGGLAVQFAPSILATAALLLHWFRQRRWVWSEEMTLIVLVCLATTGYGAWGFDLVVLLIPIVDAARRLIDAGNPRAMLWSAAGYLLLNAAMLTAILPVVIWTPGIAIGYLIVRAITPRGRQVTE